MGFSILRDIPYAVRLLRSQKAFAVVAIGSLGLGLALVITTAAVMNAFLIRALPFPAADRLYHVNYVPQGVPEPRGIAALDWRVLDDLVDVVDHSAPSRLYVTADGFTQEIQTLLIAPGVADALGVRVAMGRTLGAEDFRPGTERVALISDELWRRRFGADPGIIGRQLQATLMAGRGAPESYRIVGVLEPGFRYARGYDRVPPELVTPLLEARQAYMVRLRDGIPAAAVEARLTATVRETASAIPEDWPGVRLEGVQERYVGELRPVLIAIGVAVAGVLLTVTLNLAVLTLLRALRRRKEMAVRIAIGAARGQVARLLITESAVITAVALALGVALSALALGTLGPAIESRLGRPTPGGQTAMALDPTVLAIAIGLALVVATGLAILPLLVPWGRNLGEALRSEGRGGTDGPSIRRWRALLVAGEFAAALALLTCGGLTLRSVVNLARSDLGIRPEGIVRLRLALPEASYPDESSFIAFYERFLEQVATGPNVQVALLDFVPLVQPALREFEGESSAGSTLQRSGATGVGAEYFDLMGVGIAEGRAFTAADRRGGEPVAIVSATLARALWPEGGAVGRRLRSAPATAEGAPGPWRTVIGVASDVRQTFDDGDQRDVYVPFLQVPNRFAPIAIRSSAPPEYWLGELRRIVGEIDPGVLVSGGDVLAAQVRTQLAGPRFLAALLAGFALFATLVTGIGIYGVTAFAVGQREREIAIRLALGASPSAIRRLFIRQMGVVLLSGLGCGLLAALATGRLLASQLHGISSTDPFTLALASTGMLMVGVAALLLPLRRAVRQDPRDALGAS